MAKVIAEVAKSGIVATSFKACLDGDVYPRVFAVGEELTGEALEIGEALEKMGGKAGKKKVDGDKNAGRAPENKAGFTAADEPAAADTTEGAAGPGSVTDPDGAADA